MSHYKLAAMLLSASSLQVALLARPCHCLSHATAVKSAWRRLKLAFFEFIQVWRASKSTSEQVGMGLRRENVRFPESKKLKP